MHGALLINKPKGITSFDVIRHLRKQFPGIKMGHLGTLDPLATGLLPVFLGAATRLIRYFNESDKTYEAVIELGKSSDTFDADGKIGEHTVTSIPSTKTVHNTLQKFLDTHLQKQPPFSAIKRHGKPAYLSARKGSPIQLGKRHVSILDIREIRYHYPIISFTIDCSSGTYIRALAHEFGQALGTGAILTELNRTTAGTFSLQKAITMEHANMQQVIPIEKLIMSFIPDRQLKPKEKAFLVNCFSETRLQKKGESA